MKDKTILQILYIFSLIWFWGFFSLWDFTGKIGIDDIFYDMILFIQIGIIPSAYFTKIIGYFVEVNNYELKKYKILGDYIYIVYAFFSILYIILW